MPEKAVTTPLQIVALRAESYEPENGAVVISLRARYSTAERKYLVPIECLHDLVLDLQRLNAAATVGVNAAPEWCSRLLIAKLPQCARAHAGSISTRFC